MAARPAKRQKTIEHVNVQDPYLDVLPSTTFLVFLSLRKSFPIVKVSGKDRPIRPVVLKSQLRAMSPDATLVEREVDELRKVGHPDTKDSRLSDRVLADL